MVDHYNKYEGLSPKSMPVFQNSRAFYDDLTSKAENQAKAGRSDNRGIAVVILDALTRMQNVQSRNKE
ncbi:hypothetical protein SESBI_01689 [Sesbania bispinosa]|nr:hypothetical protein SESBI_01689 [Sesbania bispinosa]